jgi:hypothetical protein
MKKIIFGIPVIIVVAFFGFKFYLLNKIDAVVVNGEKGEFLSSSHLTLKAVDNYETKVISTAFLKAKTYVEFSKQDIEMPQSMSYISSFGWEKEDEYKIITISDMSNQAGIVDSYRESGDIENINELLGHSFESDYALLSFCFSLNYQDINLFSSFSDLKVYPFCFITRSIYLYRKGGLYEYQLTKDINVIQIGSAEHGDVTLYFHKNTKGVFSVSFSNVEQKELDLFLNTVETID